MNIYAHEQSEKNRERIVIQTKLIMENRIIKNHAETVTDH